MPQTTISVFTFETKRSAPNKQLRWATQIAEALKFVHDAGIIHGDLTSANIFLDANLNPKVADFAGSSIDGSPLLVVVTESHEYPGPLLSIKADLFALDSVFYEIMTGYPPYKGLMDTKLPPCLARESFLRLRR